MAMQANNTEIVHPISQYIYNSTVRGEYLTATWKKHFNVTLIATASLFLLSQYGQYHYSSSLIGFFFKFILLSLAFVPLFVPQQFLCTEWRITISSVVLFAWNSAQLQLTGSLFFQLISFILVTSYINLGIKLPQHTSLTLTPLASLGVLVVIITHVATSFVWWQQILLLPFSLILIIITMVATVVANGALNHTSTFDFFLHKANTELFKKIESNRNQARDSKTTETVTENELLQSMQLANKKNEYPLFFITGYYRSGTTFLYTSLKQILSVGSISAFDVFLYDSLLQDWKRDERNALKEQMNLFFKNVGCVNRSLDYMPATAEAMEEYGFIAVQHSMQTHLDEKNYHIFDNICHKLWSIYSAENTDNAGHLDGLLMKNPADSGKEVEIYKRYPQAKFIYIQRNPLEIINSNAKAMYTMFANQPKKWDAYVHTLISTKIGRMMYAFFIFTFGTAFNTSVGQDLIVKSVANTVIKVHKDMKESLSKLPADAYITIGYSDLIADPQMKLKAVTDFLGCSNINEEALSNITAAPRPVKLVAPVAKIASYVVQQMKKDGTWQDSWNTHTQ